MRILVASPFSPDSQANHGGGVYLGAFLGALAQHADVTVAAFGDPASAAAHPPIQQHLVPLTHYRDLEGWRRGAHKTRMLARWTWARQPVLAAKHGHRQMTVLLRRLLAEVRPDVAMVEFAVMAQYLPTLAAVPTVMTDHESGAPLPADVGPRGLGARRDARLWTRYVRDNYRRAQLIQTLTSEDAERLGGVLERSVEVRPPAVPLPETSADPATAPPCALFLGNYLHRPNREAAGYLVREVWPRVRAQFPAAELLLAGPAGGSELDALGIEPGVRVVGFIEDIATTLGQVRLLLAPVFSGGGVRIKTLTALAHGVPAVTNRLGRRGLEDAPATAVRCVESPADIAAAVIDWLEHPTKAASAGCAGRDWVTRTFAPEALCQQQLARLQRLVDGP